MISIRSSTIMKNVTLFNTVNRKVVDNKNKTHFLSIINIKTFIYGVLVKKNECFLYVGLIVFRYTSA